MIYVAVQALTSAFFQDDSCMTKPWSWRGKPHHFSSTMAFSASTNQLERHHDPFGQINQQYPMKYQNTIYHLDKMYRLPYLGCFSCETICWGTWWLRSLLPGPCNEPLNGSRPVSLVQTFVLQITGWCWWLCWWWCWWWSKWIWSWIWHKYNII